MQFDGRVTDLFSDRAAYFDVYLGAHNVRVTEPERLEIRATEKYIHPNWRPALLTGDIALIKLPSPVDISGSKRSYQYYLA